MQIQRANPYLQDIIDALDDHYANCGSNADKAWDKLSKADSDWVNEELFKIFTDPRFYLENYHAIKTEDRGITTLSPFWESQEIFYNEFNRLRLAGGQVKIICCKGRQLGLSTEVDGLVFWKVMTTPAANGAIIAQDGSQSSYLFDMARNAYDYLPWWAKPEKRYEQAGAFMSFDRADEGMRQVRPGLKSNIYVENVLKYSDALRGKTCRAIHISELSAWQNTKIVTTSIFPTLNAADTIAIIESTARGRSGFFYEHWNGAVEGENDWHPVFIEFFRESKKYFLPIAKDEYFELTEEEIEKRNKVIADTGFTITNETFKWLRMKRKQFIASHGDDSMLMQEYPSNAQECFQAAGSCAFDRKKLYRMLNNAPNPALVGEIQFDMERRKPILMLKPIHKGEHVVSPKWSKRLFVWEEPESNRDYYVAADPAMGNEGGDFSAIEVIKIGRGQEPDEQVAEWHGWMNPGDLGHVVAALAYWYNEPEVAVEVWGAGLTTNSELQRVIEYDNIYRWKHIDKVKGVYTDYTGFVTNDKSRKAIIAKLARSVLQDSVIIRSRWLLNEMIDFAQDDEGGRFEAQEGNDDLVFGFMIAHYCSHESDYGKQAMSQPMSHNANQTTYYVMDKFNRQILKTQNREEAMKLQKQRLGSSIMQEASAKDFQNTAYSPVHQKEGIESRMHYDSGIPAEKITHESIQEYDWQEEVEEADPDSWMYI